MYGCNVDAAGRGGDYRRRLRNGLANNCDRRGWLRRRCWPRGLLDLAQPSLEFRKGVSNLVNILQVVRAPEFFDDEPQYRDHKSYNEKFFHRWLQTSIPRTRPTSALSLLKYFSLASYLSIGPAHYNTRLADEFHSGEKLHQDNGVVDHVHHNRGRKPAGLLEEKSIGYPEETDRRP